MRIHRFEPKPPSKLVMIIIAVAFLTAVAVTVMIPTGCTSDRDGGSEEEGGSGASVAAIVDESRGGAGAAGEQRPETAALATYPAAGISITTPFETDEIVSVGYHESSNRQAMPLQPVGSCARDDNAAEASGINLDNGGSGLSYFIMYSRGRENGPTTAVDVGAPEGIPVLSPASGVVSELRKCGTWDGVPDYHIEIEPFGADPRYRVVMIHFTEPSVVIGSEVTAGETELGNTFRLKPELHQLNEYLPGDYSHVHIQVNDKSLQK